MLHAGLFAALLACGAWLAPARAAAPAEAAPASVPPRGAATVAATIAPLDAATVEAWAARFAGEVDHRLEVPVPDREHYLRLLEQRLAVAAIDDRAAQAYVLVDRNLQVQAAVVVVRAAAGGWAWIGASAVSTGKVGSFEHFVTPLGVFDHTPANPDFRAEGTFNANHIRGYGLRGRRVYDFGWQQAERGWGDGGVSTMRLQMHATDPNVLEARLGQAASEGCIRIPATLNAFLDTHGVLDAGYEREQAAGRALPVLRPLTSPFPWPGHYLVIVDSGALSRPAWSPLPARVAAPNAAAPKKPPAAASRSTPGAGASRDASAGAANRPPS